MHSHSTVSPSAPELIEQTSELLKRTPAAKKPTRSRRGEGSVYYEASKKSWTATLRVKDPRPGDAPLKSFRVAGPPKGQKGWKEARDAAVAKRDAFAREAYEDKQLLVKGRRDAWFVSPWVEHWLEVKVRPTFDPKTGRKLGGMAATTYTTTENLVRLYIAPWFKNVPLRELSTDDVKRWLTWLKADLAKRGLSTCQAVQARKRLVQAIKYALECSTETGLKWNPVSAVPAPEYVAPPVEALGSGAEERLISTAAQAGRFERLLVLLGTTTGARRQELAGAQFGDFNLPALVWKIQRKANRLPVGALEGHPATKQDGRRKKQPKTVKVLSPGVKMGDPNSFRLVPLAPEVAAELLSYRQWLADQARFAGAKWTGPDPSSDDAFVFPQDDGDFICPMALYDRYVVVVKRAGVEVTKLHQLRHEALTTALKRGVAPHRVQQLAGHKQLSTTMGTYAHFVPSDLHDVAAELGAHYGRGYASGQ